jgi:hypothetical protein
MIFTPAFGPCFFSLMAWIMYLRIHSDAKCRYYHLIVNSMISLINGFLYPLVISPGINHLCFNMAFFINCFVITLIAMMSNGILYYLWKGLHDEKN